MKANAHNRLSRTFHRTFKPERTYMTALLRFTAAGKIGDIEAISRATGIPTGESSGKVLPTIDYCASMGLVKPQCDNKVYSFTLTEFGRSVLLEDPFLKEPITLWIAHCHLCHPLTGADVWYQTFMEQADILGMSFTRQNWENILRSFYGESCRNPIGPMISMYTDTSSFGSAAILTEESGQVMRSAAPLKSEYYRAYGAWIIQLMADFFPKQQQISITDLERLSGWKRIAGWHPTESAELVIQLDRLGIVRLDRHMTPWLLEARLSPEAAWQSMYEDLI